MTNFNLTQQRIKFPWQTKPQGLAEFNAIIDVIDQPILLVERQKGTIWGVNPAFGKLANCDAKELIGQKVDTLITEIDTKVLPVVENEPAVLIRKLKDSIGVNLVAHSIGANQQLYLLKINLDVDVDLLRVQRQERMVRSLACLASLSIDGDFDAELKTAVKSMQAALEVSNLCIYQADSANPRLIKLVEVGAEAVFPEAVSSTNLIRLSKTTFWQAGKRMMAEIHHAGRDHQMQFVGSVPLGQSGRLFGLLVVSDRHELDLDMTGSLEVLGGQITRFIENFMLAENLRQEISESPAIFDDRSSDVWIMHRKVF